MLFAFLQTIPILKTNLTCSVTRLMRTEPLWRSYQFRDLHPWQIATTEGEKCEIMNSNRFKLFLIISISIEVNSETSTEVHQLNADILSAFHIIIICWPQSSAIQVRRAVISLPLQTNFGALCEKLRILSKNNFPHMFEQ